MSDLAKTHIEIIDESSYGAGTSAIIPLYVFATAENKVIDEDTGEIAPGTVKEAANEVVILTSRRDVTDTYGIPYFETIDGTVQQGSEINEVGLYGLYDALGNASLAYAMRADIDLNQLTATSAEPKGKVDNLTLWFDMTDTQYGLFRAVNTGNVRLGWARVESILTPTSGYYDEVSGKPLDTYGENDEIAVVCLDDKNEVRFYEKKNQEWFLIGSDEWKAQFPSSALASKDSISYEEGATIAINGTTIELPVNGTFKEIKEAIDAANIEDITAEYTSSTLKVSAAAPTLLEISDNAEGATLTALGFEVEGNKAVIDSVELFFRTHTQYPSNKNQGSIWLKTTEPNNGAKYLMKRYNSTSDSWEEMTSPVYGSFLSAELAYGPLLDASSMIVKYEDGKAELKFYQFGNLGLKVTGSVANPTLTRGGKFALETIVNNKSVTYTFQAPNDSLSGLLAVIKKANMPTITVDSTAEGYIRFVSSTGNTMKFSNVGDIDILGELGIAEGEASQWVEVDYIASVTEPYTEADYGTYWFNDELRYDIMVNDGEKWLGYRNYYPCAEIFATSEEPRQHSDGSSLVENDLWINTSSANYPEIYRFYDTEWERVDNTDQTTPLGIVFADARENAGPSYEGSLHTPFSTKAEDLLLSDYVDPNCVNPQTYPAGIMLFNTMFSTNNVKVYKNTYEFAVRDLGTTYQVGNSAVFTTPGFTSDQHPNPKTTRWETISGNALDGAGLFGRKAQRAMVVRALAEAINSNEDIRSTEYDFFYVCVPGYPEVDDELVALNAEKKEMFYIISDTPKNLAPTATAINNWATNKNNAASHGEDGRVIRSAYMTRQYPPMGITSNLDGNEIAVPSSIAKMKNVLNCPRGMVAAGTQYGQVKNLASVGYITPENEYAPVTVREGLGQVISSNLINPIMPQRNTGLLFWGENTENSIQSTLSDEHAILTILRLKRELDEACMPFFFQPNTESVRRDFDAVLRSILNDYMAREEIYDFVLVTDRSVNTNERIERNELWAEIGIDVTKFIHDIYIPIRVVKTGSLSSNS